MRRRRYCRHGRSDLVADDRSPDYLQQTNAVDGSAAAMRQAFLSRTLVGPSKLEQTGRGDVMASLRVATGDRIIEPMIALASCSTQHRIVVAGSKSIEMMLDLQRRGFLHAAATANCGRPTGQYDVALVDWRRRSFNALETTLDWLVNFLKPGAVLVVWVDAQKPVGSQSLRMSLVKRGFMIEQGTVHDCGYAVAARRQQTYPLRQAA
jgi:hypothetical protein